MNHSTLDRIVSHWTVDNAVQVKIPRACVFRTLNMCRRIASYAKRIPIASNIVVIGGSPGGRLSTNRSESTKIASHISESR